MTAARLTAAVGMHNYIDYTAVNKSDASLEVNCWPTSHFIPIKIMSLNIYVV